MAIRKVQDVNSQRLRNFTELDDGPGTITANTYLRGNAAGTELEFSNILPAFVGWYFINTNAGLLSLSSGNLLMGATGTFNMVAAIVDVSTGQFYSNNGMYIGAPGDLARTPFGAVETASLPGIYFYNAGSGTGDVTFDNGASAVTYHRFGIQGSARLGDIEHNDGTRFFRWDASANKFSLESTASTIVHAINGAGETIFNEQGSDLDFRIEGDTDANLFFVDASADKVGVGNNSPSEKLDVSGAVKLSGELMGARATMDAGTRNVVAGTTSGYLSTHTVAHSSTVGLVMPRAGSIVGVAGLVSASGHAGTGDMTFEVRKNNTVVFSTAVSVTGNGVFKSVSTQSRGTDTFSASDLVQLSWTNAGTYAKDSVLITVELQFDT